MLQVIIEGNYPDQGCVVSVIDGEGLGSGKMTDFAQKTDTFKQAKKLANMLVSTFGITAPVDDVYHNWDK